MPRRVATQNTSGATSVTTTIEMPKAPAENGTEKAEKEKQDFWSYMAGLTTEQWKDHIVYLTREQPKTTINGVGGYLTKLVQSFDVEDIKQAYGGREFSYIMKRDNKLIYSGRFSVEAPPRFDSARESAGTAVASSNGESALLKDFVNVLREELQRSREANNTANPATDEAIKLVSSASEKAMNIVAERANANGSGNSTQQLSELVNIVKGLIPQQSSDGGILGMVLKPLLEKLLTPPDPMAQVTTFLTIFEKIDSIRGGGGDSKPKDWRAMLAEGVVAKGPELLREVRETFQESTKAATEKRATAEAIERMETARRNGGAPAAQPGAPSAVPAHAAVMPAGPLRTVPLERSAPAEPAATPAAAPGMSAAETDAVGKFMEQRIVEMIRDDRDPEDVVDFIEDVDPTLNDMLATYSADMVTTFLAARPIIGHATQHPKWNDFLFAAQKYIKEIREEDKAIEAAAAAVPS